jgi:cholesterol oxidase
MTYLASPIQEIKPHYEVVVVGSGYGGAIAASRMARAGRRVCVLERGEEWQPGDYPETIAEGLREIQADLPDRRIGRRTALFDFHVNPEISVLVGCGLGGTSLINANVVLPPDPRVFDDPVWPQALRADVSGRLEEGVRRATEMLRPVPYPDSALPLAKLRAMEKCAAHLGAPFYRPPIAVTFEDGVNHVGVGQRACSLCGNCVSGCNHGAKNTVLMNYLPDACNHGAEIFTRTRVRDVQRKGGQWLVHFEVLDPGRRRFGAPLLFVAADLVILAAGTLGSTEILLRSREHGLPLSDQLGEHFSGNADVLGFAYDTADEINCVGVADGAGDGGPGPCICGIIDLRDGGPLENGMVIEEGALPSPLAPLLRTTFAALAAAVGKVPQGSLRALNPADGRATDGRWSGGPRRGALRNLQTFLVMAHDDAAGKLCLQDDRLRIRWPGVGRQEVFQRINARLEEATCALHGRYVPNPVWTESVNHGLMTVHPLGGCRMAESAENGVVDHRGQVFAGTEGDDVHPGLYVCDGAIVPRAVGVNPLLTISALAERCCTLIAEERGWTISYALPSRPARPAAEPRVGIRFTETMRGYFSTTVTDDFERAFRQGEAEASPFEFTLTITSDDLQRMLDSSEHRARLHGSVTAPALSPHPLTVSHGQFNLLTVDAEQVRARRMRYRMRLTSEEGRSYFFDGYKSIHDDPGLDVWADTTTLFITVHEGDDAGSPVVGKGILRIRPADFTRQLTTMRVLNAPNLHTRLRAMLDFGRFFAGSLYDVYGGVLSRSSDFDPEAPPRKARPLQAPAPELYSLTAPDGVGLRLTRYPAGDRGPVLLTHGLGVSSFIFALDTIETNLVEYLCAHGYDVWLLDCRTSVDLPACRRQSTLDDVALLDYPAAVARVRAVTGARDIQVVAHCLGSVAFLAAMLAGLDGVRSAVCSQATLHLRPPRLGRLKAGIYLPNLLSTLGVESLSAYADRHANWKSRLFDLALRMQPVDFEERCTSPVCRRIVLLYSHVFRHDRLNTATHDHLHELFGVANIAAFEHLTRIVREGRLVAADGRDAYLPHLERLAIPITFLHGEENGCFLPEGSEKTLELLGTTNGWELYRREAIAGYGHSDCIFGRDAARDVYPFILRHLEETRA